ncbi:amidohydrolase family protein 21 [Achromobacter xylosoxidans A8]|uniref:Amidohydrolase family protein 21 n=1 Tax=Achromobacter xylosoxidans (strain A8) TaxID=762376 RepID=E3HQ48_ACHXA|nr:amidohydrolase [Achromobacter xylosoxidans]ADP18351.1 amidohydrolase family protein 21 [Achromobacter xylosoxidans A8]
MSAYADMVLHGGRIATLDETLGVVSALAIRHGRVVGAGTDADCLALAGPATAKIDLDGAFAMPGINDSHCHPDGQAVKAGRWDDLSGIGSPAALLWRIAAFHGSAPAGAWYLGFRLDENDIGGYPSRAALDAAAPGRPVFLLRRDAQVGVANKAAFDGLAASGLARTVPEHCLNPAEGMARGRGVFAFTTHIAAGDRVDDYLEGYPAIFGEMARVGITSVHNALTSALAMQAYRQLHAAGKLPVRVGMMLNGRDEALVDDVIRSGLRFGFGDEYLHLLGVEYGSDGSTSGRTAAYYRPYAALAGKTDAPQEFGDVNFSAEELAFKVGRVMAAGLQAAATGNGDRGIDFALDAFEHALAMHPGAVPPRIEHCCCAPPAIQARMARLGVIDSSAAGFAYNLGDAYLRNRPESDWPWLWPHRDMLDRGVLVCGHSDAPVCDRNPFLGMWSMVNRKTASGAGIGAAQAISVDEAMRCYTVNPARAERQYASKGTLAPGKLADLIVLDRDLYRIPADQIKEAAVRATLVGGRAVFRSPLASWADQLPEED